MRTLIHPIVAASTLLLASTSFAAEPVALPTPAEIQDSINRGKEYLYSVQNAEGTWEEETAPPKVDPKASGATNDDNQWGNRTAIAVYTLLETGERPTDAKLQKAIQFLHTNPAVNSTYSLSLKCMVWSAMPQTAEVKKSLRRDAAMLLSYKKSGGPQNYMVWDFFAPEPTRAKSYRLTDTQNAAMGLAAAVDADYEVPADVWKGIERTFVASQNPDGGWRQKFDADLSKTYLAKPIRMDDTAGAAAAVQIAQDFSRTDAAARGNAHSAVVDKALEWMNKNYAAAVSEGATAAGVGTPHDSLYGIEQVALATGLRRFNSQDWYADGSVWYLANQRKKAGNWGSQSRSGVDYRVKDTCWALLFLQRGRVPLAMAKLDYSNGSENEKKALWNQRPRDAANVVRWIGRSIERDLRWQIVTTEEDLNALLEAPVLYLPGGDALALKADAKAKLKDYVDHGGLIFAVADASNPLFSKTVERLGLELFPGYEWRDIPDTHPLFSSQVYKRAAFKTRPLVRGLSNGVREMMVLIPNGDPAKTWQLRGGKTNPDAWQLAANVVSYAVSKTNFYPRGQSWLAPATNAKPKKSITVGRVKYKGAWDVEPEAWPQFLKFAQARDLTVSLKTIEPGVELAGVDVLYVSGATSFSLDDATRDTIKTYLDGGGKIIFEAAGGSASFAASAQSELTRWYGADALTVLPAGHAIYGEKPTVAYRGFNLAAIDKPGDPSFRGIEKDGKLVALLSREDLTAGLLGVNTDGITGYTPESARSLLLRILQKWK